MPEEGGGISSAISARLARGLEHAYWAFDDGEETTTAQALLEVIARHVAGDEASPAAAAAPHVDTNERRARFQQRMSELGVLQHISRSLHLLTTARTDKEEEEVTQWLSRQLLLTTPPQGGATAATGWRG